MDVFYSFSRVGSTRELLKVLRRNMIPSNIRMLYQSRNVACVKAVSEFTLFATPTLWMRRGLLFFGALYLGHAAMPNCLAQTADAAHKSWWQDTVEQALSQSGTNRAGLESALLAAPEAQRAGYQFLLENMPRTDLKTLPPSLLVENTALAYEVMGKVPWAKSIPNDIFLNEILPYCNINETRESWRKSLHDLCWPLVKDCRTPGEAAQKLNQKLFGLVHVKYSTGRKKADQSPSESMATGLASCTGLTILLVDACRSVGVPARLVAVPMWSDDRGNHTWAEIWDQKWHFTGAAEPDSHGLDHAWFEADAAKADKNSREHSIYAASYRRTGLPLPMDWAPHLDSVSAENVTDHYTPAKATAASAKTRLMVRVLDRPAGKRVAAKVQVTDTRDVAVKLEGTSRDESADWNDMVSFEVERGHDYMVSVQSQGKTGTSKFSAGTGDQETLVLNLGD
jgi:hypothetical protein